MQSRLQADAGGNSRPQYPIESVDNALKLLLLFGERSAVRLTEASQYLGVASSTAHRLLAMLQYRGFVRQDDTKAYRPGPALTNIAFAVLEQVDLRQRMRPVLVALNTQLRETVHLGVLEGNTIRFIDAIESPRAVRVASRVGRSLPAHCTSTGKALLAQLPLDELRRLYPEQTLEQLTPRSLSRRDELERQLEKVRRSGYAVSREESEEGVSSVSVAVPSTAADPPVAVNASVPTSRMPATQVRVIADALKAAATEIRSLNR